MSQGANVNSIEALADFRAALVTFIDDARDALCANDMEIQRAFAWLEDMTKFWQKQIRVRQEEFEVAKRNLNQRKMMRKEGRIPDCTEQEEAFALAKHRLREAEEKLANSRHWVNELRREVGQYLSPARQMSGIVEVDLPRASAILEKRIEALEAYVGMAPPTTPGSVASAAAESLTAAAGEALPAEPVATPEPKSHEAAGAAESPASHPPPL
jgi:hypothetical protein